MNVTSGESQGSGKFTQRNNCDRQEGVRFNSSGDIELTSIEELGDSRCVEEWACNEVEETRHETIPVGEGGCGLKLKGLCEIPSSS